MSPKASLVVRAVAGFLAVAVLAGGGWMGWDALARRPIAQVRFTGDTSRVAAADLERLAAGLKGREARAAPLESVREAVRRLPWVRDCSVRLRFPDTLEVQLEAHAPLARWDDTRLVSTKGEVFTAAYEGDLPRFEGPENTAPEMAKAYRAIAAALAPIDSPVARLHLSARRAWQATLASGLRLELGRGDYEPRLARFAALWPSILATAPAAAHADLRYANGFALRESAPPKPAAAAGRKA
jgi:cell division protein FtsQ